MRHSGHLLTNLYRRHLFRGLALGYLHYKLADDLFSIQRIVINPYQKVLSHLRIRISDVLDYINEQLIWKVKDLQSGDSLSY